MQIIYMLILVPMIAAANFSEEYVSPEAAETVWKSLALDAELEQNGEPAAGPYIILAKEMLMKDLRTGREFRMVVPNDTKVGDKFNVQINRGGSNPGIDTERTVRGTVQEPGYPPFTGQIPGNSQKGDVIEFYQYRPSHPLQRR